MPDLISHTASVFLARNFFSKFSVFKGNYFTIVLFGVIMPDLIARPAWIVSNQLFLSVQFFHTPIACFMQTILISCCFNTRQRVTVFYALNIGWVIHQAFDLLQLAPTKYYYIFWPLYDQPITLGLFLVENWPWVALLTVLMAVLTSEKLLFRIKRFFCTNDLHQ